MPILYSKITKLDTKHFVQFKTKHKLKLLIKSKSIVGSQDDPISLILQLFGSNYIIAKIGHGYLFRNLKSSIGQL